MRVWAKSCSIGVHKRHHVIFDAKVASCISCVCIFSDSSCSLSFRVMIADPNCTTHGHSGLYHTLSMCMHRIQCRTSRAARSERVSCACPSLTLIACCFAARSDASH